MLSVVVLVATSASPEQQDSQQYCQSDQAAEQRTNVIARHVQPGVERGVGKAVGRGPVQKQVEGIERRIGVAGPIAVEVSPGDSKAVQLLHPAAGVRL